MNATTIQAMIAVNAVRITCLHNMIDDHKFQAEFDFQNGDTAHGIEEMGKAEKIQRGTQMRKAVALQRDLKAELSGIHREARIARKTALVRDCVDLEGIELLTSHEQESALDKLIVMFVPKKQDSRVQPQAKAA